MIVACSNISKSFGTDVILQGITFHINDREKAGIVGINGAGKSTLLKIIIGEMPADTGEVTFSKGSTFGYLSQHQDLASDNTVYEELLTVKAELIQMEESIRNLEHSMKHVEGEELEQMLSAYTRLTHEFESRNGYAYKSELTGVLKGLGFTEEDFAKTVTTLSGGQKTRLALGKLLLSSPDVIFLDEPTNHLDMNSIAWLETYLLNYKGAVVIVAHDRYFMDKVVTKIVEIDQTKANVFVGNYSSYAEKKAQMREIEMHHYLNQQQEIKHQEEVIAKLRSFNREKSIKRAESREKMLSKIDRVDRPAEVNAEMHIRLEPRVLSGNDVLTVKGLSKAFGPKKLFDSISFEVKRGERIAIIGANGTGKTTLLKLLTGDLPADNGEFIFGAKVHVGYYDQEHQVLHPEKTIFEEIQDTYPEMNNTKVRNTLAAFLFTGDDVFKQVKELSGGERGRVSLAKLMLSESNFLILDEPTNHLDIISKEILEKALNAYEGTVLFVSHDRYFINKTATRILDLTHLTFVDYRGDYDFYLEKKTQTEALYFPEPENPSIGNLGSSTSDQNSIKADWQQQKEEQARLRKKQNELKKTEDEIHQLEKESSEIDEMLTKESVFSNSHELMKLNTRKEAIDERLLELMELWEELAD